MGSWWVSATVPEAETAHLVARGKLALGGVGGSARPLLDWARRVVLETVPFRRSPSHRAVPPPGQEDLLELVVHERPERGTEREGLELVLCGTRQQLMPGRRLDVLVQTGEPVKDREAAATAALEGLYLGDTPTAKRTSDLVG